MNPSKQLRPAADVYRLHVNTSCKDREGTLRFCLGGGFLGMGWPVRDNGTRDVTWEHYEQVAGEWYDEGVNPSVRALHDLPDAALIWTRNTRGAYYLGKVTGPWRYLAGDQADHFDIHNVRPARIVACGLESVVPGKVANAFIPRRTLQRLTDKAARRYSASLFAQLTSEPAPWRPTLDEALASCLTSQDLEDLLAVYLQRRHGYLVLPGSRRPDTPAYEYVLRHPDGHTAVVQVKSGWSTVPRDAGSLPVEAADRVYVFSPTGSYGENPAPNVTAIAFDELTGFMRDEPTCLPPTVEHWARLAAVG